MPAIVSNCKSNSIQQSQRPRGGGRVIVSVVFRVFHKKELQCRLWVVVVGSGDQGLEWASVVSGLRLRTSGM